VLLIQTEDSPEAMIPAGFGSITVSHKLFCVRKTKELFKKSLLPVMAFLEANRKTTGNC